MVEEAISAETLVKRLKRIEGQIHGIYEDDRKQSRYR